MNSEVENVFTPRPMISFRNSRKLSSYLVRAKLYPYERIVGSCKCGKEICEVCSNILETDTFKSSVTGESYKINHQLNCDNKCLIYLLTCGVCKKQYVGQTTDKFRMRWNNYKSNSKKFNKNERCFQEHIFRHFQEKGHTGFLNDVSIRLIDKTDGSNPTKREDYWIKTLKTNIPYGLNVENIS